MEIKDIIKTDSDRLFIVDPECYIIFTGESTDDIKPFIRIGNWLNMPPELIPLVENIILADRIIGNPSYEQFNIDIRSLATNRYIGSKGIIRRFLDYQKIFGLDLKNASIVDIEKDIPELSREKNISEKGHFIGVFYRDGNFKTLINSKSIFDLNSIAEKPINYQRIHNHLSNINKNTRRYNTSGIIIIGHNPFFYRNNSFSAYLYPANYFEDFTRLNIDPAKIEEIFYPSLNLINITKFLKWKNSIKGKTTIFTNNRDIALAKRLFSDSEIKKKSFNGLQHVSAKGVRFRNYSGTYNLSVTYESVLPESSDLTIAYIKGSSGIREIIGDGPDGLFISYSAFEDINMMLKSTDCPIAVIDDGNKNISRLAGRDTLVIRQGIQYEMQKFASIEGIFSLSGLDDETISALLNDHDRLNAIVDRCLQAGDSPPDQKKVFNILSLLRLHIFNTPDRKLSQKLHSLASKISEKIDKSALFSDPSRFKIILAFYNNTINQIMADTTQGAKPVFFDEIAERGSDELQHLPPDVSSYHARILEDRARLKNLLDIYLRSSSFFAENMHEVNKLKRAIEKRRIEYDEENLSFEDSGIADISPYDSPDSVLPGRDEAAGHEKKRVRDRIAAVPLALKIVIPIILLACIAAIILFSGIWEITLKSSDATAVQSEELDKKFSELGKELNIRIRDRYILRYANEVALKNGYHRIAETNLKEKNPDWIYPENIFVMLDGQRVIVSSGDNLWNLSKNKLIEMTIKFNDTLKEIERPELTDSDRFRLTDKARDHAFTDKQKEIVEILSRQYKPPQQKSEKNDTRQE